MCDYIIAYFSNAIHQIKFANTFSMSGHFVNVNQIIQYSMLILKIDQVARCTCNMALNCMGIPQNKVFQYETLHIHHKDILTSYAPLA